MNTQCMQIVFSVKDTCNEADGDGDADQNLQNERMFKLCLPLFFVEFVSNGGMDPTANESEAKGRKSSHVMRHR